MLVAGALFATAPMSARAQEDLPDEIRGVRIVVPAVRGKPSWGSQRLTRALRRDLEKGVGTLVPPKALAAAQKKLKIRGNDRYTDANLARAGKEAGAEYVLSVRIIRKGWLYTAHAVLINADTGEQQMDFRSGYFKPKKEAADRGKRIAKTTLGKIAKLLQEAPPAEMAAGAFPDAPEQANAGSAGDDDILSLRLEDDPPTSGGTASASTPSGQASAASGGAVAVLTPEREDDDDGDLVTASLTAGSGLLHTYDLSSADVDSSGLSYRLSPVALLAADVEVRIPGVGVGAIARLAFSPVLFEVNVDNAKVAEPGGSLLDFAFGLNIHLPISGSGRRAYEVVPAAGLRLVSLAVDKHPGYIILESSSVTPFVGVAMNLPVTDALAVSVGLDGGFVVSYTEAPDATGTSSNGGLQIGGALGLRYWLMDMIGLSLETRFDMQSVSLGGKANRQLPQQEELEDASISTKDLRTSIGVAFRI